MNFLPKTSPVRLTESATRKLPRSILLMVGVCYIYFGLFLRDPWKTPDIAGLATMMNLAQSGFEHLIPHIGTYNYPNEGFLTAWIGALFIKIFAPFFTLFTDELDAQIIAARMANFLYIYAFLHSLWYATYLLARRNECQPIALPFGGEPNSKNYGRMIADVAFMFTLATLGIIIPLHETSGFPLTIAILSICLYSFCRLIDRPYVGSIWFFFGCVASLLNYGLLANLPILLSAVIFIAYMPAYTRKVRLCLLVSLLAAIGSVCLILYLLVLPSDPFWFRHWINDYFLAFTLPDGRYLLALLRDSLWFFWPILPFAILAVYQWRHYLYCPHIYIPVVVCAISLCVSFFIQMDNARQLSFVVPSMTILAAMAVPTMKRHFMNVLDWFAIMVISLTMLAIWLGWIALHTGVPTQLHHNITRLLNGYEYQISPSAITLTLIVNTLWIMLVSWRLHLKPSSLWRGVVLFAGGLTLSWIMLALLWLPSINYNRSYRNMANQLAQVIQQTPHECIASYGLKVGQRAALNVFSGLNFSANPNCDLVLVQTERSVPESIPAFIYTQPILWQGGRLSDSHEYFYLIRLK